MGAQLIIVRHRFLVVLQTRFCIKKTVAKSIWQKVHSKVKGMRRGKGGERILIQSREEPRQIHNRERAASGESDPGQDMRRRV